jgi:hypothetical protein
MHLGLSVDTDDLGAFGDLAISTYDFPKDLRVVCLLLFDDQNFFVVTFGQVSRTSRLWMWWGI